MAITILWINIYIYIYASYFESQTHVFKCLRMISTAETCSIHWRRYYILLWLTAVRMKSSCLVQAFCPLNSHAHHVVSHFCYLPGWGQRCFEGNHDMIFGTTFFKYIYLIWRLCFPDHKYSYVQAYRLTVNNHLHGACTKLWRVRFYCRKLLQRLLK
jgi:hypothetical protein